MRKAFKYFIRALGGIFIFLALFVIAIPLLFKNEILESIRRAIDRQIEGEFSFQEAKVGILRTFPNLYLDLTKPILTGGVHPEGDSLFKAESLSIVVDINSLIRSGTHIKVVGVRISSPHISLYSDTSGVTNYQLATTTDSETNTIPSDAIDVEVEEYRIDHGIIKYVDDESAIRIAIDTLYHSGKLYYQDDYIELRTTTEQGKITIISDGIAYLDQVFIAGTNDLNIDLANSVYTLLDNHFRLNALEVDAKGNVSQNKESTAFDLEFDAARSAFKHLLSILPNIYTSDFDALNASGNIALAGTLKGKLSEESVPVYTLTLKVDKGVFQYPGKPLGFSEVAFDGALHNTSQSWSPSDINLSSLHFLLNNSPFDASIRIQNPTGRTTTQGTVKGTIDLADVINAYPLPQVNSFQGVINADFSFDIDPSRPASGQQARGKLELQNIAVVAQGEEFKLQSGHIEFSQTAIHAITQNASLNGSSLMADINAQNYVSWLTNNERMTIGGDISIDKFDANRYLSAEESETLTQSSAAYGPGLNLIRYDGNLSVQTLVYDTYVIENGSATLHGTLPYLEISQMQGKIKGTHFSATGSIADLHTYLDGSTPLTGTLECQLDKVYVDKWIEEDEKVDNSNSTAETIYVALPADLDFDIKFHAQALEYDNIEIQNPRGMVHLTGGILEIHDFKGRGMGGDIVFSGLYNTQDVMHPVFSMKYDLRAMRFNEVFRQVQTFRRLAPIAEFVQGIFNSTLVLEGRLGKNYFPDLSTLSASGFLETLTGTFGKTDILDKVSQFLNLEKPLKWDIANTKNWFDVKEGYVTLQEVHKTVDGIEMGISGRHQIQGDMDYLIKLNIPADRVSSNPVGELAKTGYEELQKKASGFGVKLNTIESFIVHVAVRGRLKDPKFEVAFFDASGKTLKEAAADQLDDLKQQAKDTLTAIAEEKIEAAKDSIQNVIDIAVDSARRAAEERLKETGKEIIGDATAKLDSTLRDSITNAILEKIGDKARENLGQKETDKIKDALEKWDPFKKKKKDED